MWGQITSVSKAELIRVLMDQPNVPSLPVHLDPPSCIRLIRDAAQQLGVPHRDILSQAGHDAYYISRIAPTARR